MDERTTGRGAARARRRRLGDPTGAGAGDAGGFLLWRGHFGVASDAAVNDDAGTVVGVSPARRRPGRRLRRRQCQQSVAFSLLKQMLLMAYSCVPSKAISQV